MIKPNTKLHHHHYNLTKYLLRYLKKNPLYVVSKEFKKTLKRRLKEIKREIRNLKKLL